MRTRELAQPLVHRFRGAIRKIGDALKAKVRKVLRDARPNTRNRLKVVRRSRGRSLRRCGGSLVHVGESLPMTPQVLTVTPHPTGMARFSRLSAGRTRPSHSRRMVLPRPAATTSLTPRMRLRICALFPRTHRVGSSYRVPTHIRQRWPSIRRASRNLCRRTRMWA
jgi:hypothetical protein